MTLNIKRGDADDLETFARENCVMLLAAANAVTPVEQTVTSSEPDDTASKYTCKTCDRKFTSFQALGGHRASHVKPKPTVDVDVDDPLKPKTYECSICGVEFGTGQALGGHMRRHRPRVPVLSSHVSSVITEEDSDGNSDIKKEIKKRKNDNEVVTPMLRNLSSSNKRVCLELSLGYAPFVVKKEQEELVDEIEEGEIVEEEDDFLKLELRQPIRD